MGAFLPVPNVKDPAHRSPELSRGDNRNPGVLDNAVQCGKKLPGYSWRICESRVREACGVCDRGAYDNSCARSSSWTCSTAGAAVATGSWARGHGTAHNTEERMFFLCP